MNNPTHFLVSQKNQSLLLALRGWLEEKRKG